MPEMFVEDDEKLDERMCEHAKPGAINLIKGRAVCVLKQNRRDSDVIIRAWKHRDRKIPLTYIIWISFAFKCRVKPKKKKRDVNWPCRKRSIVRGSGRDYSKNNASLKLLARRYSGRERSIIYCDLKWHRVLQRLFCCSTANCP